MQLQLSVLAVLVYNLIGYVVVLKIADALDRVCNRRLVEMQIGKKAL